MAETVVSDRVLLVYPSSGDENLQLMPLSLLYVAQPLLENGIRVDIVDERFEEVFFKTLGERLGPDLICVGISCISGPQIESVSRIARFLKSRTNLPIVLGGPHATLFPESTLKSGLFDFVVVGSGEVPFLNLVTAIRDKGSPYGIPQVGWRQGESIKVNDGTRSGMFICRIPYHLMTHYPPFSTITLITSFGCPYHCTFCVEKVLHPRYWERSTDDVLTMIDDALAWHPQFINFIDDNFLTNKKRVREILSRSTERGLRFRFVCMGRVDEVLRFDGEFFDFLIAHGIDSIYFGVESGSPRILELIRKGITPAMVLELNETLRANGIVPHYSFMAGYPTETREDRDMTTELMKQLKEDNPRAVVWKINRYTPYPGTRLYDLAVEKGFRPPEKFEDWNSVSFYSEDYGDDFDVML
jgi:anaerobic magnesium-protoporphyrin IX monomethyl ester cyclase